MFKCLRLHDGVEMSQSMDTMQYYFFFIFTFYTDLRLSVFHVNTKKVKNVCEIYNLNLLLSMY